MTLWSIFLVYVTLATPAAPAHLYFPPETAAVPSQPECVSAVRELLAKHAFDRPGMKLVFAGCQRVDPVYGPSADTKTL